MRKSLLTMAVLAAIAAPHLVLAEEAKAEEAKPDWTVAYNIGLFSSYSFRGIEQTKDNLALQGGVDITHSSGFYVGSWGSNISWLTDSGAYSSAPLELDLYGGYRNTIPGTEIGYDIGLLGYYYPGDRATNSVTGVKGTTGDTIEGKLGLSYSWLSGTAWYILTKDGLGTANDQGSYYLELNANIPVSIPVPVLDKGVTALVHIGRQEFESNNGANNDAYSYTDWRIGASKAFDSGVTVGGYYTDTNASSTAYTSPQGEYLGKGKTVLFVSKTF